MAENRSSLINAGPRLDAGLEKTPGQNLRILMKRRVSRENTVPKLGLIWCPVHLVSLRDKPMCASPDFKIWLSAAISN